ncbi:hypothetical protein RvY_16786-2 [Ramazzottius varieornatus]|uniref:Uncharacterized protein n=1 Tax=Ramazzottius varieornatus TaxID=947166 RepID=A0A1D1VZR8_RAMVA|nr:hypothetical protein RvY_16786-2 [Ramazzottius varieornatus]
MPSGLMQQDFIPECTEPGSFGYNPSFERLNAVVAKANFFLAHNPGVAIVSCETIRHRVEKDGQLKKPSNLSFTQYGSEITGCYVDGLRMWLTPPDTREKSTAKEGNAIQIEYFHVLPQCGKESAVQDTMNTLTTKLSNQLSSRQLQGRLLAVEAIDVRGVKQPELLDAEAATLTAAENPHSNSVMTFLRVWWQREQGSSGSRFSVGMATFVPELNLDTHETFIGGKEYKHLNRSNVEQYSKVMAYVNSWVGEKTRHAGR